MGSSIGVAEADDGVKTGAKAGDAGQAVGRAMAAASSAVTPESCVEPPTKPDPGPRSEAGTKSEAGMKPDAGTKPGAPASADANPKADSKHNVKAAAGTNSKATAEVSVELDANAEAAAKAKYCAKLKKKETVVTNAALGFTAGGSFAVDALQAVGQVVLKKATRAAWGELKSRLERLADCEHTTTLAATCKALDSARIEDILVSPKFLLDALVADLVAVVDLRMNQPPTGGAIGLAALAVSASAVIPTPSAVSSSASAETARATAVIARVVSTWKHGRLEGVLAEIKAAIYAALRSQAGEACPSPSPPAAVFWLVAECLGQANVISERANTAGTLYPTCAFDDYLATCDFAGDRDATRNEVRQVAELAAGLFSNDPKFVAPTSIQFFFEWSKLADPGDAAMLDGIEALFLGVVERDWIRAVHGMGAMADVFNAASCSDQKACPRVAKGLLQLMGAVGQFAETYQDASTKSDPAVAAAARQKVIEDLVTSMVDRTDREHGAVVSVGGSLGLFGGQRYNDNGSVWAFPVRLTLGAGLQTYWWKTWGLHVSAEAFDLGQYVTYSKGDLNVDAPDLKSVIVAGGSLGVWFANRETPLFAALHGSVSPFVRTSDGKLTYELGVMLGIYVPLLDFN
jgi:hypothetical protein